MVRHGESTWNELGLIQGQADGPTLTDKGRRQSAQVAEEFRQGRVGAIYSSDLARARETAAFVGKALGLPIADGATVPLATLSLHAPSTIISGLRHLGIPVSHYVGVDLHAVNPASALGELATGKLSVASMMSNPTGTSSILTQVASHIYLGPGTPVSAVLSLMNVPTAHPVSVPTERDVHGTVVLAGAFENVLRAFL